jgi:hypothetical protein
MSRDDLLFVLVFQLFGFLVYAVPLCGRFFGLDDELRHRCTLPAH